MIALTSALSAAAGTLSAPAALARPALAASSTQAAIGEGWMVEGAFWIALASLVATTAAAVGVWAAVVHLRRVREETQRLTTLDELDAKLGRLVADRDDLDLRRVEHALIDIRDGQRRLEDAILRSVQRAGTKQVGQSDSNDLGLSAPAESISERVVNRMLALGYDRVQIVTRMEKLAELVRKDGEVLVEAKRDGVLHKGRVLLRDGRIGEIEMNPAYSIFP